MTDFDGIAMIWQRDLICYFRERSRLLGSISRPILWLFIFGMGLRPTFHGTGNLTYTEFIFPGVIAMTLLFTAIQSAISIIWDREFGFLKEVLVAPVSRASVAVGKGLSGATLALIGGLITLLFAPFIGVHLSIVSFLVLIPLMFLLGFAITGVGILIAARMTSFEGFGTISNFLIMPMYFMSGAIFPPHDLPEWLMVLVRINPLTYGVDLLRGAIVNQHYFPYGQDLLFLVCFAVIVTAISFWSFLKTD
jgi:ABC-2 type transport system permease protein